MDTTLAARRPPANIMTPEKLETLDDEYEPKLRVLLDAIDAALDPSQLRAWRCTDEYSPDDNHRWIRSGVAQCQVPFHDVVYGPLPVIKQMQADCTAYLDDTPWKIRISSTREQHDFSRACVTFMLWAPASK